MMMLLWADTAVAKIGGQSFHPLYLVVLGLPATAAKNACYLLGFMTKDANPTMAYNAICAYSFRAYFAIVDLDRTGKYLRPHLTERPFRLRDGSTATLTLCLLICLADLPEACAMLNIYNNRCLRCNYNPFARSEVADRTVERAKTLHYVCAAAAGGVMGTVATLCQREGMHFVGQEPHASLSLPHPNIFRAVSGIGHLVELGVLLRLVQAIACEIHRLGDPIFTSVNARLREMRSERPYFGGVRAPSATNITSLFSRRSPMTATELISVAPLILVAIKDHVELKNFAGDLKEGLYVLSFCYAPEPRESELAAWQTELDNFQTGVLSGERMTTPLTWEKKKKKNKNDVTMKKVKKAAKLNEDDDGTSILTCVCSLTVLLRSWHCNQEPHRLSLTRYYTRLWRLHCGM